MPTTLPFAVVFAIVAVLAVAGAALLYRSNRRAAWLAAASTSSCLYLVVLAVAAGTQVARAALLTPLWLALVVLCVAHLQAAHRAAAGAASAPAPGTAPAGRRDPEPWTV